jgi:outer membrane protein OmpA-like peptidoglycan-associated protein
MPFAHVTPRAASLRRAFTQAMLLCLLPLAPALAQSVPRVEVTRDDTDIRPTRHKTSEVLMTAARGTVLEVIHVVGNRYQHRDSNWYLVLLPRDAWGDRPSGWVRGDAVTLVPPDEPPTVSKVRTTEEQVSVASDAPSHVTTPGPSHAVSPEASPASAPVAAAARITVPEVVLFFPFDKSELTDEAVRRLADAVAMLKASGESVSIALEGHADWTGPESYNEKLGLARAETVRQYLAEQLDIPPGDISVVSFGESTPAAPNTTLEGRAMNRRVLIKAGSSRQTRASTAAVAAPQ